MVHCSPPHSLSPPRERELKTLLTHFLSLSLSASTTVAYIKIDTSEKMGKGDIQYWLIGIPERERERDRIYIQREKWEAQYTTALLLLLPSLPHSFLYFFLRKKKNLERERGRAEVVVTMEWGALSIISVSNISYFYRSLF